MPRAAFLSKPLPAAVSFGAAIVAGALFVGAAPHAKAQPSTSARSAPVPAAEQGVRWNDLNPTQRAALKPLERDWSGIDAPRKQKWLELAARFPSLQADEKARVQARMTEWAKLSADERREARVNYQQATRVAPQDRRAQWEAYQSLPAEERNKLAARAAPDDRARAQPGGRREVNSAGLGQDAPQGKSNIVPNPAFSAQPRAVAPTVLQAEPGATTTLISKRPVPPPHQQTGLPKIAASPNFVDKATLLPQRGPQGAATRSAAASAPEATRRR